MNKMRPFVFILAIIILIAALYSFIQFTQLLFAIQTQYENAPSWLIIFYVVGISLIALTGAVIIFRLRHFGRSRRKKNTIKKQTVIDDTSFYRKMDQLRLEGVQTATLEQQWQKLIQLRASERVSIALFGEINVGKSTLIQSLTEAHLSISAKGGETQEIVNYPFEREGRKYDLIDMPGFGEVGSISESVIRERAIKSHLVLFMMDEDLTASAFEAYKHLLAYQKPVIIVLNKKDFFNESERNEIKSRIEQRLSGRDKTGNKFNQLPPLAPIVWVQASMKTMVDKEYHDGRIEQVEMDIPGQMDDLLYMIEEITFDRLALDGKLSASFYKALEMEMDLSLAQTRKFKGIAMVKSYSQKAMFGGMVAVSPGTDVLLQGYLGMNLTKGLCGLYEVSVKEIDLEMLLQEMGGRVKKELAMILSLVGNAFKAFPGVGTLAGGAVHAVVYALIFEAVGNAMLVCLEKYQYLDRDHLMEALEEQISGNLEQSATRLAKLALFKK